MKTFEPNRLPDILTALDGTRITTKEQWEAIRRPEIIKFFKDDVFGIYPNRPNDLQFNLTSEDPNALDGSAVLNTVEVSFSGPYGAWKFPFYMFVPKSDKPVPATLLICNRSKTENMDITRRNKTGFWPVEAIVKRGYAAIAYWVEDVDTDKNDSFTHGVHQCFQHIDKRGPHDWATLSAWAWAAMRVMDYLVTDSRLDKKRIALVGQSRGGKTSLFAASCDTRFRGVYSSNSGCVGTSLARFKDGETLTQINTVFPYWFCDYFKRYNDHPFDMPFDQHELMACIAPRLLYVGAATEDAWADPACEFLSTKLCGASYALYGLKGIPMDAVDTPDVPIVSDAIGFHDRVGEHDLTEWDWMRFIDFFDARTK